jgi:hypothetical protein
VACSFLNNTHSDRLIIKNKNTGILFFVPPVNKICFSSPECPDGKVQPERINNRDSQFPLFHNKPHPFPQLPFIYDQVLPFSY